jgi:hypothetical protein
MILFLSKKILIVTIMSVIMVRYLASAQFRAHSTHMSNYSKKKYNLYIAIKPFNRH